MLFRMLIVSSAAASTVFRKAFMKWMWKILNKNEQQSAIIHFHFSIFRFRYDNFFFGCRLSTNIMKKPFLVKTNSIQLIVWGRVLGACVRCLKASREAWKMNHLPIDLFPRHTSTQNIWFNLSSYILFPIIFRLCLLYVVTLSLFLFSYHKTHYSLHPDVILLWTLFPLMFWKDFPTSSFASACVQMKNYTIFPFML